MEAFASHFKRRLLKLFAYLLYYSRGLAFISRIAENFILERNSAGKLSFPYIRKNRSRPLQILVYHRVNDENDPFFPAIPTRIFAKQLDYLQSNCNVLSLDESVERLIKNDLPECAIIITFDDGYRDNFLNAFPILQNFSLPATIFLSTDFLGTGRIPWHERVFSAFRTTTVACLEGFLGHSTRYPLRNLEDKLSTQNKVLNILRSLDDDTKSFWVGRLLEQLLVAENHIATDLMLSWGEIALMFKHGISFGSHTVTHPILSKMQVDKARKEILGSKRAIEEKLEIPITAFAYPGGRREDFNISTKKLLQEAGYHCALTSIFGVNHHGQDLFELRRGGPWELDLPTFALKLHWYRFHSHT